MSKAKQIIWRQAPPTYGSAPIRGRVGSVTETRLLFSIHWGVTRSPGKDYIVRTTLPVPSNTPELNGEGFPTVDAAKAACQAFLDALVAEAAEA